MVLALLTVLRPAPVAAQAIPTGYLLGRCQEGVFSIEELEVPLPSFFKIVVHVAILPIYANNSYHTAEISDIRYVLRL